MRSKVSCFACRTSKRRCDKQYPTCSLCFKRGIGCHFPSYRGDRADPEPRQRTNWAPTPDSSDSQLVGNEVPSGYPSRGASIQGSEKTPREAPEKPGSYSNALGFLAPEILPVVILPNFDIPPTVLEALGNMDQMRDTASRFFDITKYYFPIVARKRYFASLLSSTAGDLSPRLALLTLAMKLMTGQPTDRANITIYEVLRSTLKDAQDTTGPDLQLLQSNLILGLYEISHAMLPAAYLTLGQCARYSQLLHIEQSVDKFHMREHNASREVWTEVQEQRRVWWAVLVLDRFLKIQNISAPLALDSPPYETYLPSDDYVFDQALQFPPPVTLATGLSLEMGLYSRLCQAIFLTSQCFDLLNTLHASPVPASDPAPSGTPGSHIQDPTDFDKQTSQLRKTIIALVAASQQEAGMRQLQFCSQTAICYSTILLLQQQSRLFGASVRIWPESVEAIRNMANMAKRILRNWATAQGMVHKLSAFLVNVTYLCLSTLRHGLGPEDLETREILDKEECDTHLEAFLQMLSERWGLAGAYLEALQLKRALQEVDAI